MAMFENLGMCPNNGFSRMNSDQEVNADWDRTSKILGDRKGYMVYSKGGFNAAGAYIFPMLMNDELGLEIAIVLRELIPECKYAETGKMILITDVINPEQITFEKQYQSINFLVACISTDEAVEMQIYKKRLQPTA